MAIFVIGLNHKTASIALREQVFFAQENLALYLQDLLNSKFATEAVLLSTCHRSELYCDALDKEKIKEWFCTQHALPYERIAKSLYCYESQEAVAHIMAVACGLDSMILGESQILGQMKAAFSESCAANTIGSLFHALFQEVFAVAKEIRTSTSIGACPVSLASAALHFVKQKGVSFEKAKTFVIGSGETAELLLRYLKSQLFQLEGIVSRNQEKATELAKQYVSHYYSLEALPAILSEADLILSATGSALPLITYPMAHTARAGREKPLFILDMAVPRDVQAEVGSLQGVQLYCIDDLKTIIETHRQGRAHAAEKAHEKIMQKSFELMQKISSSETVNYTIRVYREQIKALCETELNKAKYQLSVGHLPEKVLEAFAHALTNRLLHAPSVQLRRAGIEGRIELLHWARQLFALPDLEESYNEAIHSS